MPTPIRDWLCHVIVKLNMRVREANMRVREVTPTADKILIYDIIT